MKFLTGTNSVWADTFTFISRVVKCFNKISRFVLLSTQLYLPCKNIWCHFENYFKLEIKTVTVALLAFVEVIVLVLLPDYTDGHKNVS